MSRYGPVEDSRRQIIGRLVVAVIVLNTLVFLGAASYYAIGQGRWSWFDCVYMTVITASTVGFGETLPGMDAIPAARYVTLALIILGSSTLLYFLSNITVLFIESDLQGILRVRRMQKRIAEASGHIIVCGAGSTGEHVIRELVATSTPFVIVDSNPDRVAVLSEDLETELMHVIGDATDDHSLMAAGIERARGVIAALSDDKDNLFITITVRHLNDRARIVAKAIEASSIPKLRRAGATAVVSPNQIGGMRLVSEMVRPTAMEFLDRMLRTDKGLRIEEACIPEGSAVAGKTLAEARLRDTGALVLAVRGVDGAFRYNPGGDVVLEVGATLIVIAHAEDHQRLNERLGCPA